MSLLETISLNFDLNTILAYSVLYLLLFLFYYLVFHTENKNVGYYRDFVWYQPIKFWWAKKAVRNYQNQHSQILLRETDEEIEKPNKLTSFKQTDRQIFYGADENNNFLYLKFIFKENRILEICMYIHLADGTIYQLPEHPAVSLNSTPDRQWSVKGLNFHVVQPFKVIQITYNGLLRNCTQNTEESNKIEHVYFNYVWTYNTRPIFHPEESNVNILSNAVASEPWKDGKWIQFLGLEHAYKQFGALLGFIKRPNSTKPPTYMHLMSCRTRLWGPSESKNVYRSITIFCTSRNGHAFVVGVKSFQNGCRELQHGAIAFPNGQIYSIDHSDLSLVNFDEEIVPRAFKFSFSAKNETFKCTVFTREKTVNFVNDEVKGWQSQVIQTRFMLNGTEKFGSVIFWKSRSGNGLEYPTYIVRPGEVGMEDKNVFVAKLEAKECKSLSLTGEKTVSNALLYSIETKTFSVPSGFCVLVPAFKYHIEQNERIKKAIDFLNNCSNSTDIHIACENVCDLLINQQLPKNLEAKIDKELYELRQKCTFENVRFVIIPSYVENSEYLSANRYADKFFDLSSDADVKTAIKKSWATQFTYENVSLKRTHSKFSYDMSVVVRLLIPSEISGNLFTNHPSNTDPSRMFLTASFGGIQGSQLTMKNADEITISRTWNNQIAIESWHVGSKTKSFAENKLEDIKLCLSEKQILKIADIGVLIEKSFAKPCLVKWTYCKGIFYVLSVSQSINLNSFSSFIIPHDSISQLNQEIVRNDNINTENDLVRLYGYSNNKNIIMGRACVIKDLQDTKNIKTGDILITTNLDVSYGSKFSQLNAIVTEIDGTFSYASTVSREFNVPCLINCRGATNMFSTGDVLIFNGKHCFVEKIG